MQVTGNVAMFGGSCTASNLVVVIQAGSSSYSASLRLSCPDAGITNVLASLAYNGTTGTITVSATGGVSLLNDAVQVSSMTLSTTLSGEYLAGEATGALAGSTCSVSFNVSKAIPVGATTRKSALALAVPNVNFGALASSLWSSIAGGITLPNGFNSITLPKVDIWTPAMSLGKKPRIMYLWVMYEWNWSCLAGVYAFKAASGAGNLELYFDKSGVLAASMSMAQNLNVADLLSQVGMTLPVAVDNIMSISAPAFRLTSDRVNAAVLGGKITASNSWSIQSSLNLCG